MATITAVEKERKLNMALDDLVTSGSKRPSKGDADRYEKRRRTSDSDTGNGNSGGGRNYKRGGGGDRGSGHNPENGYGGHSQGGYDTAYAGYGHAQGYNQSYGGGYYQGNNYGEGRPTGKGAGRNTGGSRRRLPPEDKALMHTRAFFTSTDEFIVKLHETEVFTLRAPGQTSQVSSSGVNLIRFVREESQQEEASKETTAEAEPKGAEPAKEQEAPQEKQTETAFHEDLDDLPELSELLGGPVEEDLPANAAVGTEEATAEAGEGAAAAPPASAAKAEGEAAKDDHWPHQHSRQDELDLPDFGSDDEDDAVGEKKDGETLPQPEANAAEKQVDEQKPKEQEAGSDTVPAAAVPEQNAVAATTEASKLGVVVSLNSGTYRTLETKYIMNEALETFGLKIAETGSSSSWEVSGDNFETLEFKDKMEFVMTSHDKQSAGSAIKTRLERKVAEVKARESKAKSSRGEPYSDRRGRQDGGRDARAPPGAEGGAHGAPPGQLGWGAWPPIHPASPLYRPPIMPAYGYYPHPLHPPAQPASHPYGAATWSTAPQPSRPKPRAGESLPDSYFQ